MFGYDCNLGSLKRERTLHQFAALENALRDKSWSTCEINPRCNWDVKASDVTNQEAIKLAQTKLSLA